MNKRQRKGKKRENCQELHLLMASPVAYVPILRPFWIYLCAGPGEFTLSNTEFPTLLQSTD